MSPRPCSPWPVPGSDSPPARGFAALGFAALRVRGLAAAPVRGLAAGPVRDFAAGLVRGFAALGCAALRVRGLAAAPVRGLAAGPVRDFAAVLVRGFAAVLVRGLAAVLVRGLAAVSAARCSPSASAMSIHFLDGDQVAHHLDHAAVLGAVVLDDHVTDPLQPQRTQGRPLRVRPPDSGPGLGYLQVCHRTAPGQLFVDPAPAAAAWARSMAAGATSPIGSPRLAAISSGRFRLFRAATVACTTLIGFDDPRDRDSTSWTPAHSSTARTGPPAMTPVPGLAGFSSTTPADCSPWTVCGIVPAMRGTRKNDFLAASTPLAMAAGTSLALP